jgi:hypothetical protein
LYLFLFGLVVVDVDLSLRCLFEEEVEEDMDGIDEN